MVLVAVEFVPAESTPPAAAGVSISKGERYDFGAAALLPTRVSSLEQGRARGPVKSSPKLVELSGRDRPGFVRTAIPTLRLNCCRGALRALASLLACWHVCLHGKTWLPSVLP